MIIAPDRTLNFNLIVVPTPWQTLGTCPIILAKPLTADEQGLRVLEYKDHPCPARRARVAPLSQAISASVSERFVRQM